MSAADKDGRMAQIVSDLHACLGMSIHEGLLEAKAAFAKAMAETSPAPDVGASVEPSAPPAATGEGYVFRATSVGDAHHIVTEAGRHRCLRCGAESVGAAPALPCIGRGQQ